MSAGERVAAQYRGVPTEQLRQLTKLMRNERRKAAVRIVLAERAEANQKGYDAGQTLLDVLGGYDVQEMHDRAIEAAERQRKTAQHIEAEQSQGMADALWEWIQDRSDT